jgi:DNA-binding MarR family transcriptional regulator
MNLDLRQLYHAIGDLVAITNRPQPGLALMREAGISLDRALFVLLVRIERRGPIGIVELAEVSARDYTTVSRQVNKLESLGLASRRTGSVDRRVREVVITPAGLALTGEAGLAREKLLSAVLAKWTRHEIRELTRLSRRLTDAIAAAPPFHQLGAQEPRHSSGKIARRTAAGGRPITKAKSLKSMSRRQKRPRRSSPA